MHPKFSLKVVVLFVLGVLFGRADDLLLTDPDGSTVITRENAYAIYLANVVPQPKKILPLDRVAKLIWPDPLDTPGKDPFLVHDFETKKLADLKSVIDRAGTVKNITVTWRTFVSDYDFTKSDFPMDPNGDKLARDFPGVFIAFDQKLPHQIDVAEDKARDLSKIFKADHQVDVRVKGTLLKAVYAKEDPHAFMHPEAMPPEQEVDRQHSPWRLIISPTTVEYWTIEQFDYVTVNGELQKKITVPSTLIASVHFEASAPASPPATNGAVINNTPGN
jgi:hypothetical protein